MTEIDYCSNKMLQINCGFTKRWAELREHEKQSRLIVSPKRFIVLPCGRRSGKTEIGKRKLVQHLAFDFFINKLPWDDCRYFAAAPTRDQAKRIYWNDLKAMVPDAWVKRKYDGDLCIVTKWGSELWVLGLDKPARIEGTPWNGGVLDEYANMKQEAWKENVRPALSDRRGWCWLIGVPEGRNHYFLLWQKAISGLDPEWGGFTWKSSEILAAEEIEAAKRDLDERTYLQEYEGDFVEQAGIAYYAFNRLVNVRPVSAPKLNRKERTVINVGMDFNVAKMCACFADLNLQVFGELALRNSNTPEMAKAINEKFPSGDYRVVVWPDATGKNRDSTSSKTDHQILRDIGFEVMTRNSNPLVKDRVNTTNSVFKNAAGEIWTYVDPSCRELIEDCELVVWKNGDLDGSDKERTHMSDAFGYMTYGVKPMLGGGSRGIQY
jgi:hypothetical protein